MARIGPRLRRAWAQSRRPSHQALANASRSYSARPVGAYAFLLVPGTVGNYAGGTAVA
ncbi:hypothetical protein FKP32DRAFT_1593125 [Trametes sanguinea]|nr:hypothetical protein FKP32DRAFT_1593125 [Trametes sanguinea]